MEAVNTLSWKFQLKVLIIFLIWFSGINAYHLDQISQKKNATQKSKLAIRISDASPALSSSKNISANKNLSKLSQKSVSQLQLEIKELLRMQKQLTAEIVSGKSNTKKRILLKQIKTQIHLRKLQQKRKEQRNSTSTQKPPEVLKPVENQKYQQQSKIVMHQDESTLQHVSIIKQKPNQHKQRQHKENQKLKQMPNQTKSENFMTVYNIVNQGVENNAAPEVLDTIPALHLSYQKANLDGRRLEPQQQNQLKAQKISHPTLVQQRLPINMYDQIGLNSHQFRIVDQQDLRNDQAVLQMGSPRHVVLPISALALNNIVPRNTLPRERFIVIDTSIQDNGQIQIEDFSPTIKIAKESQQKPTTIPPTTAAPTRQVTRTTTTSTRMTRVTTAPTTLSSTLLPSPTTTEGFVYEPIRADTNSLKKELYRGELQKQNLEIRKLKLEIRALQGKVSSGMSMPESEADDAPPRPYRMRFNPGRMPFRFFGR